MLLCVAISLPVAAKEPDDLPGLTYPTSQVVRKKAPELQRKLMSVLEGLQRTPQLVEPRGVSVHSGLSIATSPELRVTTAEATLLLKPIFKSDDETYVDKKTGRYQGVGEGNTLELKVNDLERLALDPSLPEALFYEPTRVGTHQGLPVYKFGNAKPILVITAKDRQLWRRITVAEYLTRISRERGPDGEAAKRQLGQLASGAADEPACVATRRGEIVGSCAGARATHLVVWNPGYFDARKPDALQLVTVRLGAASHTKPTGAFFQQHPLDPLTQVAKVYAQYDWSQVAKLVE